MTREHKVALIVGFSLILLIAVLLSDHFSRARSARVEPIHSGEFALAQPDGAPIDPLLSLEQPAADTPVVSEPAPADPAPPSVSDPSTFADGPAPTDSGASIADTQLAADIARLGGTVVPGAGGTLTILPPVPSESTLTNPAPGTDSRPSPPASQPGTPPAAVPESIRLHPVKKGENLYRIAEKYYGSGAAWKKLADANRDRVAADGAVREGVQLRIPDVPAAATAAARPASKPTEKKNSPAGKPAAKPGPIRIASARTYTVLRGDTLGGISLKTLGTSRRASEIKALNAIKDEDDISAGAVLKIPGG